VRFMFDNVHRYKLDHFLHSGILAHCNAEMRTKFRTSNCKSTSGYKGTQNEVNPWQNE